MSRWRFVGVTCVLTVLAALLWWSTGSDDVSERTTTDGARPSASSETQKRADEARLAAGEASATPTPLEALGWKLPTDEEMAEVQEPFEAIRGREFYDFRLQIRQAVEGCLPKGPDPRMRMVEFVIRDMGYDELRNERKYEVESARVADPGPVSDEVYQCLQNAVEMRLAIEVPPRHRDNPHPDSIPELIDFSW